MRQVVGILLVILGTAYLAFQGFRYTTQEKVLDIGPLEASAPIERQAVPFSPVLGGVIIAGGATLLVLGTVRRTT